MQTRDQQRASYAYSCVRAMVQDQFDEYATLVNGFGATVMRNGLVGALAFIERRKDEAARRFLEQLKKYRLPGLGPSPGQRLPDWARQCQVDEYMLVTREILQLVGWFRRAVQASQVQQETKE